MRERELDRYFRPCPGQPRTRVTVGPRSAGGIGSVRPRPRTSPAAAGANDEGAGWLRQTDRSCSTGTNKTGTILVAVTVASGTAIQAVFHVTPSPGPYQTTSLSSSCPSRRVQKMKSGCAWPGTRTVKRART